MLLSLILIVLALLGTPLFAIIAAGALLGFYQNEVDLTVVAIEFYRLADMSILLAIPLFTFAGYLLSESRAPERLMRLTQALLGWLPGGLAMVALTACALLTAFTGASGVTIVALGALLYPALIQAGQGKLQSRPGYHVRQLGPVVCPFAAADSLWCHRPANEHRPLLYDR